MASTMGELTWLSFLLRDIGVPLAKRPYLFCNNLSAPHLTVNLVFHACTKHVELDYHFVHEKVSQVTLITRYAPSSQQLANLFTKPLSKSSFQDLCSKLGLCLPTPSLKGVLT